LDVHALASLTIPATISINHNVAFGLEEKELYSSLRLKSAPWHNNVEDFENQKVKQRSF